ncbi:alpha/beta hydrolase [Paenisporosarcina antarctica]|uniref:Alpha/beta fold hydrolase n=1 Tax=Paenisporosarcina antarctica TaxID=417367 RepID=A0A4P6ZWC7_9BACL|nr:carboxylesterase [Paenisporosarcina antarctica]QBP40504.1 alpha/beta fold hydrolase [Paenisporosarcina antarctica]
MRIAQPKPFFFEAGKRAVLLLHGFTGNSSDVRMLGRFLEKNGYTSLAPHYKGHGVPPEELILTGPTDWWQDVISGYDQLKAAGYEEIAVAGLSLGGVFSLKLGYTFPIKGIVTMCAPMSMKTTELMYEGVLKYARDYKRFEGKDASLIEEEVEVLQESSMESLPDLRSLVYDVRENVDHIYAPLFVVQGRQDSVIDTNSANIIYDEAESFEKEIKWYEKSGHVITLDLEKEQLHEDILGFLQSLEWQE